ncbi:Na/Pi cotransporter family protein [Lachnospiraceae bacterium ZAX-1]
MDFFGVLSLVGGLALFLYGMNLMGTGLEQASGGKLEQLLEKLTSNRLKAVLLGLGVTAVIQSSSATTVMLVGFVNSGIMKLSQAIGVIMGANIGTTVTSWLISLTGIQSDNFFMKLLKPSSFSPVLAMIGIILIMGDKAGKKKDAGNIMVGFATLMFGMEMMSAAVTPLRDVPEFTGMLLKFTNPLLGVLAGAVLTAIIQSSSASVGILQALSITGALTYGSVIPIILGQNIGTCITAILSAIGANKGARRTALVHLYFNIIGSAIFLCLYYILNAVFHFEFVTQMIGVAGIALVHSIFNIFSTVILFPFTKGLEKLAYLTIPETAEDLQEKTENESFMLLDSRFLATPSYAIEQCRTLAFRMAELSKDTLMKSIQLIEEYSEEKAKEVKKQEDMIDRYDDKLKAYLVELNVRKLNYKDSQNASILLHGIGDLERIGDHALNIMEQAQKMNKKKLEFSKKAIEEMSIYRKAIEDILARTITAFTTDDVELALSVEPLEEVIDQLNKEVNKRYIKRLKKGKCTIELGLILADIATNYERVADHCSNLAVYLIQMQDNSFGAHDYVNSLKDETKREFDSMVENYQREYMLP